MIGRLFLLSGLVLITRTIDLCELVNKDYCFYFGESHCYLKICECEQEQCTSETNNCTHSYWCDANGDYNVNDTKIQVIDLPCDQLSARCLDRKLYNGYCYFYERQECPENPEIKRKAQSKSLSEACQKWGQTCVKKWDKHFACRQFLKFCHDYTLPPRPDNNTVELNDVRHFLHNQHGDHWERRMTSRCRRWQHQCLHHNNTVACRRVDNRCEDYLTNSTVPHHQHGDSSSSEEDDRTIQLILTSTDSKDNHIESTTVETSTGPNYVRNMMNRCRAWRSHCKRHPNSHQCETYVRRCREYSIHYKEDVGNSTAI